MSNMEREIICFLAIVGGLTIMWLVAFIANRLFFRDDKKDKQ
jgi:hypothetical protein